MATTVHLPQDAGEIIVGKIRRVLVRPHWRESLVKAADAVMESTDAAPLLEMAETFKVFKLTVEDLERFEKEGGELATLAQDTGRLHHQLKFADGSIGCAQTKAHSDSGEVWPLCELFVSPLGKSLDDAIAIADEKMDDNLTARLLLAPAYQVFALWFCNTGGLPESYDENLDKEGESFVMLVSGDALAPSISAGEILPAKSFLQILARQRPFSGVNFS